MRGVSPASITLASLKLTRVPSKNILTFILRFNKLKETIPEKNNIVER